MKVNNTVEELVKNLKEDYYLKFILPKGKIILSCYCGKLSQYPRIYAREVMSAVELYKGYYEVTLNYIPLPETSICYLTSALRKYGIVKKQSENMLLWQNMTEQCFDIDFMPPEALTKYEVYMYYRAYELGIIQNVEEANAFNQLLANTKRTILNKYLH